MDCDDVMLRLAAGDTATQPGAEARALHQHVASCASCRALTAEPAVDGLRWIARLPEDAFDDPDLLVLPTVDPIVFDHGDELARGGMGRITQARDRRLGRVVAIKEVLAPELRGRFEREAMITARLQHPAIVPIYEAGAWPDGSVFYTMRLVPGGPLSEAIAAASSLEARLALLPHVRAVTEALAYAHDQRIVHRDLKPGNVLVGAFGETVVIDWGLAKELDRDVDDELPVRPSSPELTRTGSVVGTPCFLAPEQAAGEPIDERVDVYALGAILYNLLAGHPPYWDRVEHTAERLVEAARLGEPTPIAELAPRAPADLHAIVAHAMARDRAARYPSAKQLAEELRRFEAGQLLGSRTYSARERLARWIRKHRAPVVVGAVALVVVVVLGALSAQQILARHRETQRLLAESQLEQGRELLLDGAPGKAAPYLAAALDALPGDPIARRLAARALHDVPRRLASFAGTTAVFRRDGAELLIGRADGTIAVIDPATHAVRRALPADGRGAIRELVYAPDDDAVLGVASASGAELRDPRTGARVARLSDEPASELLFVPRGVVVAGATAVWLVGRDGAAIASDRETPGPKALALAGDAVVAIITDGARVWRASDLERRDPAPPGGVARFAATLDRGALITAGVDGLQRWDRGHATTLVTDVVVSLSWLDDHTLLADGSIVGTDTGAVRALTRNSVQASAVVDRDHVITGGYDRVLRVWDLARRARPVIVLDAATATTMLRVDPQGRRAITRGAAPDAPLELWDVAQGDAPRRSATVSARSDARINAIVAGGDRLAVHVELGAASATKLVTSRLAAVATLVGWPVGFRPRHGEVVTDIDGRFEIYASRDGHHLREIRDPEQQWRVAFSPSGNVIATSAAHRVWLRDARWQVRGQFDVPGVISAFAIDERGRVATGYDDGNVVTWDAHTGAELGRARGHATHIVGVEIRGDVLITTSWDLTVRAWTFPAGAPLGILRSFEKLGGNIALSPGGQLIATADGTRVVNLWDTAQGRLLQQLPTTGELAFLAFLDDHRVVAGGAAGRLELFELAAPLPAHAADRLRATSRWTLVAGRAVERR